ncbi:MAG: DUF4105 domain-containing protein [Gemmatimonadetes bacterium]|nr:DUF4105 domain-containing protein [Gemmatimonadota bacterium]
MKNRALIGLALGLAALPPNAAAALPVQASTFEAGEAADRAPEPGSRLRVWLLTTGPGDAVWERFGHNALRVLDTETGRDVAYNWGIFDFDQVDFVPRFLKGQMLYMMAPFSTAAMVDSYARANREVVMQELALTPSQRLMLLELAEVNALPRNRDYSYDYFLDNCSTRIRDLLDQVLGGALFEQLGTRETGTSYRTHTRRLTQIDPVVFTGMDVLLGSPGDRPISLWEEMFVPMTLRDAIRDATVTNGDGLEVPLVMAEEVVVPSTRKTEPVRAVSWFWRYLVLGALMGGGLAWVGRRAATGARSFRVLLGALASTWSLLAGVSGLILVLVLLTDHWSMTRNESLFLLNPVSLPLVVLAPLALGGRDAAVRHARILGFVAVGVAALGLLFQLLPATAQQTGMLFALFLPIHIGLATALNAVATVSRSEPGVPPRRAFSLQGSAPDAHRTRPPWRPVLGLGDPDS